MRTLTQATPDLLSGLLATVRVRSTIWCLSELRAPWGFAVLPREDASFHLVVRGGASLEVPGVVGDERLADGHLVVLPHGHGHALRDDPASPVLVLDELLAVSPPVHGRLRVNGEGARTDVLCGGFTLEGRGANPILSALPPVLRVGTADGGMEEAISLLRRELDAYRPGAEAVVERLTDLLITQAVRSKLATDDVRGFDDPLIARAIRLLQQRPGHRWTVDELAHRVAFSRSTFSERFRAATGESPMRYLTLLRLTSAAEDLTRTDDSLYAIARRYGYDSDSSLSRAFKRAMGVAPGRYRRSNGPS